MYIPSRRKRPPAPVCNRPPRLLSTVTVGVVAVGAALGLVQSASADPTPSPGTTLVVDIVGESYTAGDTPALQALSRVANEQPGLRVDANVVASAGAVTADFFDAQKGPDAHGGETIINAAQHDQIRRNAQVVIVGFGGNDAELARVLAVAKPSNTTKPGDLDAMTKNLAGLLDTGAADQAYLDQAATSGFGQARTLVARLLQVLAGIAERAPGARIIVTTYPVSVDAQNPHSVALIGRRDLATLQKFLFDLNGAISRAVQICRCANLVDMSTAVAGHEAYTSDSAFNEQASDTSKRDEFQPNNKGAALLANPIAADLAKVLGIRPPAASDGTATTSQNNNVEARPGVSDRDGDLVPDARDAAPNDPARSENPAERADKPKHDGSKKNDHAKHGQGKPKQTNKHEQKNKQTVKPKPGGHLVPDLVSTLLPDFPVAPKENPAPADAKQQPAAQQQDLPAPQGDRKVEQAVADPADEKAPAEQAVPDQVEPAADSPESNSTESDATGSPSRPRDAQGFLTTIPKEEKTRPVDDELLKFSPPPTLAPKRKTDIGQSLVDKKVADADAAERTPEPDFISTIEIVELTPSRTAPAPGEDAAPGSERICILIYPAPNGCGTSEQEGSSS